MLRAIGLGLIAICWLLATPPARADAVTDWSAEADALGEGNANWHTLAIMHMAMHDALNAAQPIYVRWGPPTPDEPPGAGAMPDAAMSAAAAGVLMALHPAHSDAIRAVYNAQVARMPATPSRAAGITLGRAIGAAAVARRSNDGFQNSRVFAASSIDGRWRPVPPNNATSGTTDVRPFPFADRDTYAGYPPPEPGSPRYLADVAETRRMGAATSPDRTAEQSDAAIFWAYQSTQRGMLHLVADTLDREPQPGGLAEHARLMSQIAAAMADAAVIAWAEKERYSFWRPFNAIRSGLFGVEADPDWQSFIETPPHPEYPSGHAADCFTGALFLQAALGHSFGAFTYVAQSVAPDPAVPPRTWTSDFGATPAPVELRPVSRPFPSLIAAAQECADSRIWAGVHFRSANEESRRIATAIVERAVVAVPRLAQ